MQKGFTLIELMIVVAIIGILAAIALPAYQDYTTRSKISEGLTLASSAKTSVSEHAMSKNAYPADNAAAGFSSPDTDYVSSIDIADGLITINYKAAAGVADGSTIELSPTTSAGGITWTCTGGDVDDKYRPANCR
ncbi:hypothetical protein N878_05340 [Pseudomonas sp. EGD-AK9]|nr:hypothetical protein N878_05340 [Pseudomonas sp. EGD-AK9]